MKYGALGYVIGGRLQLVNREAFQSAFLSWPDGPVWATFETALVFRSKEQNKYWHAAIVQPLARVSQVAPEQMHDALKVLLLPEGVPIRRADGSIIQTITIGGSTAHLTRLETANLIDRATALLHAVGAGTNGAP